MMVLQFRVKLFQFGLRFFDLCSDFGGSLAEVLLPSRLCIRGRGGVGGVGGLAVCGDDIRFGFCGLKCEADGFGGQISGIVLINCITGQAHGFDFGGGVAVPRDDGVEMMQEGVAVEFCEGILTSKRLCAECEQRDSGRGYKLRDSALLA
jgi:hypothetical protein